jgi:hypothetical protein
MDGLAVQVALEDPDIGEERMSALARGTAERLLRCSLPPPAGYGYAALETAGAGSAV